MKRHKRNLAVWAHTYQDLDLKELESSGRTYLKLWIQPFYRLYQVKEGMLSKKNPPQWFKKLILKELTTIYMSWKAALEKHGEPYYLKLWVGDPEFMDTQLVAATGEWIDYYETLLMKHPEPKPFPEEKFKVDHPHFKAFVWQRYRNGFEVYESEADSPKELENIQKKACLTQEYEIGGKLEKSYFIPQGDLWVGDM